MIEVFRRLGWLRPLLAVLAVAIAGLVFSTTALAARVGLGSPFAHVEHDDEPGENSAIDAEDAGPSLCGGVNTAIVNQTGLGTILESHGLPTNLDGVIADALQPVATIQCFSDEIEGHLVLAIAGPGQKHGVVLANSPAFKEEVDELIGFPTVASESETGLYRSVEMDVAASTQPGPVSIDDLLQRVGK